MSATAAGKRGQKKGSSGTRGLHAPAGARANDRREISAVYITDAISAFMSWTSRPPSRRCQGRGLLAPSVTAFDPFQASGLLV